MDDKADDFLVVGRIAGVYGVKGWVRVESYTQPITNIFDYAPWYLSAPGKTPRECGKAQGKPHGKGLVAKLDGVADRDQAAALMDSVISVDRNQLPDNPDGTYYWADLVGLAVVTREGQPLGHVNHMMETGANDVMVVAGDRERLIPFVLNQVVVQVDIGSGQIIVDWDPEF